MALTVRKAIKSGEDDCKEDEPTGGVNTPPLAPNLVKLTARAAMIAFVANLLVDNGNLLARAFGVPYRTTSVNRLEQPEPVRKVLETYQCVEERHVQLQQEAQLDTGYMTGRQFGR